MSNFRMKYVLVFLAVCISMSGCSVKNKGASVPVSYKGCPRQVQYTITRESRGADCSITKQRRDGYKFYTAEFIKDGAEYEILIDEAGRVVEIEKDLDPTSLPTAAITGVESAYPGCLIGDVEEKTVTYYEVDYEERGEEFSAKFLPNGYLIALRVKEPETVEAEIEWSELPEPVKVTLINHRGGVKPDECSLNLIQGHPFFEADYKEKGGVIHEVIVDESGRILEGENEKSVTVVPPEVQERIVELLSDTSIKDFELKKRTYLYVVEVTQDTKEGEVRVLSNGVVTGLDEGAFGG